MPERSLTAVIEGASKDSLESVSESVSDAGDGPAGGKIDVVGTGWERVVLRRSGRVSEFVEERGPAERVIARFPADVMGISNLKIVIK